ncbi:hypothetical protein EEB15_07410 [Ramlibacter sp. WS9]|nr:hypothetical protein EEB15_07410 [Ramlibacter sp. WS9]
MRALPFVGALLVAMVAPGCATVYEGKYSWSDGWRKAEVLKVGSATEIGKRQYSDCRDKNAPAPRVDRFAVLSYTEMSRKRHRVVPLQPSDDVRVGGQVYLNLANCDAPLVPRAPSAS